MSHDSYFRREHCNTSPPPTTLVTSTSMPERSVPSVVTTLHFSSSTPIGLNELSLHSKMSRELRRPGYDKSHEDTSMSAPPRTDDRPTTTQRPRFLNQPKHDNWLGPFRLPPPPPTILVDELSPVVTAKKRATATDTDKEFTPSTKHPVEDSPTPARSLLDDTTSMALETIMQVFPEANYESTRDMLKHNTVETVMNRLAQDSHGAWGEVDSISGLRESRRRSSMSDDDSLDDYFQRQVDLVAAIFPDVEDGRSEDLLKRNSISTVMMILASEASTQPFNN